MERPFSHLPISTSSRGDLEEDFLSEIFNCFSLEVATLGRKLIIFLCLILGRTEELYSLIQHI